MFGTRKRKLTTILGVVFALAIAGGAYAYWTGAGSGTGTGTVNSGTTVTLLFCGALLCLAGILSFAMGSTEVEPNEAPQGI